MNIAYVQKDMDVTLKSNRKSHDPAIAHVLFRRRSITKSLNDDAITKIKPISQSLWEQNKDSCSVCLKKFTLFRRKHHCRFCGVICCGSCSPETILSGHVQHRACKTCFSKYNLQEQNLKDYTQLQRSITHDTNSHIFDKVDSSKNVVIDASSYRSNLINQLKKNKSFTLQNQNSSLTCQDHTKKYHEQCLSQSAKLGNSKVEKNFSSSQPIQLDSGDNKKLQIGYRKNSVTFGDKSNNELNSDMLYYNEHQNAICSKNKCSKIKSGLPHINEVC